MVVNMATDSDDYIEGRVANFAENVSIGSLN